MTQLGIILWIFLPWYSNLAISFPVPINLIDSFIHSQPLGELILNSKDFYAPYGNHEHHLDYFKRHYHHSIPWNCLGNYVLEHPDFVEFLDLNNYPLEWARKSRSKSSGMSNINAKNRIQKRSKRSHFRFSDVYTGLPIWQLPDLEQLNSLSVKNSKVMDGLPEKILETLRGSREDMHHPPKISQLGNFKKVTISEPKFHSVYQPNSRNHANQNFKKKILAEIPRQDVRNSLTWLGGAVQHFI